jgi:hypothetical protein
MPRRTHPLARRSPKLGAALGAQRRAYAVVDSESSTCFACGRWGALDHSHLFPQGQNPHLRAHPLNIVRECRACHELFEHRKADYARAYPLAFAEKLRRMQALDPQRYAFFCLKNPTLVP